MICLYSVGEINKYIEKEELIHTEILNKKKDKDYEIGKTYSIKKVLSDEEILFASSLYNETLAVSISQLETQFKQEVEVLKVNFLLFLKNETDELIKEPIDQNLVNLLKEFITDYADCKVLSSALIIQQKRNIFSFVTSDRHFAPNIYEFTKEDYRFKNYKFPELKNLLYE